MSRAKLTTSPYNVALKMVRCPVLGEGKAQSCDIRLWVLKKYVSGPLFCSDFLSLLSLSG